MSQRTVRIATRGSRLAIWQAQHVADRLTETNPDLACELVVVSTEGDRDLESPLSEIGGKGVFVKEIQTAVLDGRADVAVHSAKDLPAVTPTGLVVAAITERADPRDALVGSSLAELPQGAAVGTGSARRAVQLKLLRPDLDVRPIRGNIDTRLGLVGELAAVVVATAALERLGLKDRISERFNAGRMIPQVGQGSLAVECLADDAELLAALGGQDHVESRHAWNAERGFLLELGGDCRIPAAAHAMVLGDEVVMRAFMAADNGDVRILDGSAPVADGAALGCRLARGVRGDAEASDSSVG